ncbi:hypothetical protein EVAR_30871_1 [Eumeta japonica]|uniref:Uncharacterized protein n=1 Tax=Eumeta variegata TaxID=151549 RepID=A0A4C1V388_EUMVA|nr:hypothetical protein EVAR_30871_1 [Eumeta japonica]
MRFGACVLCFATTRTTAISFSVRSGINILTCILVGLVSAIGNTNSGGTTSPSSPRGVALNRRCGRRRRVGGDGRLAAPNCDGRRGGIKHELTGNDKNIRKILKVKITSRPTETTLWGGQGPRLSNEAEKGVRYLSILWDQYSILWIEIRSGEADSRHIVRKGQKIAFIGLPEASKPPTDAFPVTMQCAISQRVTETLYRQPIDECARQ